MAGFAAALGGIGTELHDYGQQMRQILESRRDLFADLAQKRAQEETDPAMRDQWTQAAASALSGQDFGKILPRLIKAHDTHQQSTQALGQIAQASGLVTPSAPAPTPGPGSGIPNGNIPTDVGPITGISPGPAGQDFSSLLAKAAPQAPPAAQTTATAVPTAEGKIQAPPAPAQAPVALATAPATPAPVPSGVNDILGLPTPEDPAQIVQDTLNNPLWAAPANRPVLLQGLQQRLTHQEALRQAIQTKQTELAYKRSAVDNMKKSGVWAQMPAWMQNAYEAEAGGLPAVSIGSSMTPHTLSTTLGSTAPPGTMEFGTNKPVDPKTLYEVKYIPGYDQTIWQPAAPKVALTDTAQGGKQSTNLLTGESIAPAVGAVAPSQIAPIVGVGQNGAPAITSAAGAAAGIAPTPLAVTPAGLAPTVTTTSTPGQLPTTTVQKKGGGSSSVVAPVRGGSAAAPSTSTPSGGDVLIKRKYDDWVSGGPAPTNKDLTAVQNYAATHNLPSPTPMSAAGQVALKDIDPILQEVQRTKAQLQDAIKNGLTKAKMAVAYSKYHYRLGNTPYDTLISNLSFAGLRSGAAAMKGTGSHALPVVERALEHTPVLSINPDDPKTMLDKLSEMETRLKEGRDAIVKESAKSGVTGIQPIQLPGTVIPAATGAPSVVNDLIREYSPKK